MKKIFLFSFLLFSLMFMTACSQTKVADNNDSEANKSDVSAEPNTNYQLIPPKDGDKIAIIKTNLGVIKFKLFPELVPETVKNFATLAKEGKYDGSIFHRVIKDFMIQGGDFENGDGTGGYSYQGPGTTIAEEFNEKLTHLKGAVSMAKTALPKTTGSQFFIVQAKEGTNWLDNKHSVFGQVYFGLDIVDKIAKLEIGENDRPKEEVKMEQVTIIEYGTEEAKQ